MDSEGLHKYLCIHSYVALIKKKGYKFGIGERIEKVGRRAPERGWRKEREGKCDAIPLQIKIFF